MRRGATVPIYILFHENTEVTPVPVRMGEEPDDSVAEVLAQVQGVHRRSAAPPGVVITGPVSVDLTPREVPGVAFGVATYIMVTCPDGTLGEVITAFGQAGLFR